jgi:carbon monoxide dehydrogenase subunit G
MATSTLAVRGIGMQIQNEFEVPATVDAVWDYLLDVEQVAPCMPGAELTETVDDHTWKGRVNMRLGPVGLSFVGTVTMEERDDVAHRVRLLAKGTEQKGKGAASATVTSSLERGGAITKVKIVADIQLSGVIAQISRGLLPDVSARLTAEFADCLRQSMAVVGVASGSGELGSGDGASVSPAAVSTEAAPPLSGAKPMNGIRLGLWALWRAIWRFFARKRT